MRVEKVEVDAWPAIVLTIEPGDDEQKVRDWVDEMKRKHRVCRVLTWVIKVEYDTTWMDKAD